MLGTRLRELLATRKISKEEFAIMCDLPIETIRNIYYGKTPDPKVSTVMKMAKALDISVNCLMGQCQHTPEERALLLHYRGSGNHGKSLILNTAKFEYMSAKDERGAIGKRPIRYIIPTKDNIRQGVIYDESDSGMIYTTNLDAYMGIQMTNNDLVPLYCKGDIVLVANRFPINKEYGVFYRDGRIYIRQYIEEDNHYRLKCLHNYGEDMIFKRMDEIEYLGTCCGVIRT